MADSYTWAERTFQIATLELIDLPLGHVLYESRDTEEDVYFPTSVIVSLLYVMKNGDSAEIAMVRKKLIGCFRCPAK